MDRISNWITHIEQHSRTFKLIAAPAILIMIARNKNSSCSQPGIIFRS